MHHDVGSTAVCEAIRQICLLVTCSWTAAAASQQHADPSTQLTEAHYARLLSHNFTTCALCACSAVCWAHTCEEQQKHPAEESAGLCSWHNFLVPCRVSTTGHQPTAQPHCSNYTPALMLVANYDCLGFCRQPAWRWLMSS